MIVSGHTLTLAAAQPAGRQTVAPPIPRYLNSAVIKREQSSARINVKTITTMQGLAGLKDEWLALELASATCINGFQSFEWCCAWVRTHCPSTGITPYIITVYHGGRLVLVWPMMMTCVGPFCVLRWLTDPFGQYGDVIAEPGPQLGSYLDIAWQDMCRHCDAATIRLRHVRKDAVAYKFLRSRCNMAEQPDTAPCLDLTGFADAAAYDERYTRTQRRRRKRIHKQLEQIGKIELALFDGPGHLDDLADQIVAEKNIWLRQRGHYSPNLAGKNCTAFLRDIADRDSNEGACPVLEQVVDVRGRPQRNTVDRGDGVADGDTQVRGGQRAGQLLVPGQPRQYPRDPERLPVELDVGAEQSDRDGLDGVVHLSAPDVGVAGAQLADHLADHVVEFLSRTNPRQQRRVAGLHRRPVHAGVIRRPVEVALQPPRLVEDVPPLLCHVDADPQRRNVQRLRILQRNDRPDPESVVGQPGNRRAIGAHAVSGDVFGERETLLLDQVKTTQRRGRLSETRRRPVDERSGYVRLWLKADILPDPE